MPKQISTGIAGKHLEYPHVETKWVYAYVDTEIKRAAIDKADIVRGISATRTDLD